VITIPPDLVRNATMAWGADGERWLAALPRLLDDIARDWQLRLGPPYELSFNWVTSAWTADGTPVVLKLGPPEPGHLAVEASALAAYGGRGAVRLLARDDERGALLLERAEPGTMARIRVPERDLIATAALITVMRRLHEAPVPDGGVPDLESDRRLDFEAYLRTFPGDGPLPRPMVSRALGLLTELSRSAPRHVLLHGDLHHDNVLRSSREPWLAIDPHGVIGDPGAEVWPMLSNPDPFNRDAALLRLVPSRVEQLADGLGIAQERVVAWGFVGNVLSEVWNVEGTGVACTRALDVALLLEPLVRSL
jgi:streptomycin 6-kinase